MNMTFGLRHGVFLTVDSVRETPPILSAHFFMDFSPSLPYSPSGWFDDRASRLRDKSFGFSPLLFSFALPSILVQIVGHFHFDPESKKRVDRPTS
jgi:hypothetical protein